jgi:uncharacterized lipoprotein YddW (UPF0748 family)
MVKFRGRVAGWPQQGLLAGAIALQALMAPAASAAAAQTVTTTPDALLSTPTPALAQTPGGIAPRDGGNGLPTGFDDPADQVAPPGLRVTPGNGPLSAFQAIAMRQELENLMGRFESAMLLADSINAPGELVAVNPETVIASTDGQGTVGLAIPDLHPALDQSRQLLNDWPDLLAAEAYGDIRARWLAARQALWQSFPRDRPYAQAEIRAMWLDRGTIVRAGSRQRLAAVFDRLQAAGINTVFIETVNASYPIYPSRVAPQQNPLTRRWDPLEAAVELAHERGMELHAWVWVFAAGNQLHNRLLNQPADYPGPVLNAHPTWAGYDNQGSTIPPGQTKPFFDPANPDLRRYLLRLVEEIITRYDVDGVQLDYIRYPFQDPSANRTYGYGVAARQQFEAIAGIDPLAVSPRLDVQQPRAVQERQRFLWDRWTEFRIQQVTSFVAEVSRLVKRERPDIVLSTAVFAKPEHERRQKIQQDWGTWADRGLVDWIVLMSYAQDTNAFESLIRPWVLHADYSPTLVIPGIRLLNLSEPAVVDQLQALRDLPAPGYALFAVDNLDRTFQTVLSQTQGQEGQPIPQQDPFATAASRYQALQQEWRWLMDTGHLWVHPDQLEPWVTEVNDLGLALEALADNPSPRDIATARSRLLALQQTLGDGMDLQTANRPYRLDAWRLRLVTIDRFLAYGQARL